jgi:hypothetical protein
MDDAAEDQVEFLGFVPKLCGGIAALRDRDGEHSKPEFGLARLLAANADFVAEVFFGFRIIGFLVIGPDTGPGLYNCVIRGAVTTLTVMVLAKRMTSSPNWAVRSAKS